MGTLAGGSIGTGLGPQQFKTPAWCLDVSSPLILVGNWPSANGGPRPTGAYFSLHCRSLVTVKGLTQECGLPSLPIRTLSTTPTTNDCLWATSWWRGRPIKKATQTLEGEGSKPFGQGIPGSRGP